MKREKDREFTTRAPVEAWVEVEANVEISEDELNEAGWYYLGPGGVDQTDLLVKALFEFHNEEHSPGLVQACRNRPCSDLRSNEVDRIEGHR